MSIIEWFKVKKTLWILAVQEGCTVMQIKQSIQECINEAWAVSWTPGNIHAQVHWQKLFPGGKKPTVEQFIVGITRQLAIENRKISR